MRDNVKPGEKWEFNEDVAACFAKDRKSVV